MKKEGKITNLHIGLIILGIIAVGIVVYMLVSSGHKTILCSVKDFGDTRRYVKSSEGAYSADNERCSGDCIGFCTKNNTKYSHSKVIGNIEDIKSEKEICGGTCTVDELKGLQGDCYNCACWCK